MLMLATVAAAEADAVAAGRLPREARGLAGRSLSDILKVDRVSENWHVGVTNVGEAFSFSLLLFNYCEQGCVQVDLTREKIIEC